MKVRELCLALSRENAAARTIQHAFRTHLKKFWWWRVASVREEARARNVAVRDVLRHITMPLKRLEAARKIQHWVRTRAPSMLSDTYSDSCDDDSSFDSDSDSEGPMTSQCNAGAAQESLVATTVDPLSPAGKEGLRIILTRLDGKSGTEMVDPAIIMKEALMQQTLFVSLRAAGTFHVFSGLQLVKCNGPALEILGCGSIRRSGGGRAVLQAAAAYARQRAIPCLVLRPLWSETGEARSYWRHCGFTEYAELRGLWVHRKHQAGESEDQPCRCYAKLHQQIGFRLASPCAHYGVSIDDILPVLLSKTSCASLPMLLWL